MNQLELLEKLADLIVEFKNDYEEKLREQIARDVLDRGLFVIEQSKVGEQPEDADFYRQIMKMCFEEAVIVVDGENGKIWKL